MSDDIHPPESHTGNNLTVTTMKLLDSLLSPLLLLYKWFFVKRVYCECG